MYHHYIYQCSVNLILLLLHHWIYQDLQHLIIILLFWSLFPSINLSALVNSNFHTGNNITNGSRINLQVSAGYNFTHFSMEEGHDMYFVIPRVSTWQSIIRLASHKQIKPPFKSPFSGFHNISNQKLSIVIYMLVVSDKMEVIQTRYIMIIDVLGITALNYVVFILIQILQIIKQECS